MEGNRNGGLLQSLLFSGGGSGYTVEETSTVIIPEQTVTTEVDGFGFAALRLADEISEYPKAGDMLSITINGEMEKVVGVYDESLDGPIFVFSGDSTNPNADPVLAVGVDNDGCGLFTFALPSATYTISAELITKSMTVSPEFQEAVAKSTEPLVVPMTFTNPSNPLAGGTYDSTYYDKMLDAFTEGRQIMLNVPTIGLLQIINVGSTTGSAVFNCMTMAYLSNNYLLIVINLTKEGNVSVQPFTLTRLS